MICRLLYALSETFVEEVVKKLNTHIHTHTFLTIMNHVIVVVNIISVYRLPYAGDNFVRWSGDAMEMAKQQCKLFITCLV